MQNRTSIASLLIFLGTTLCFFFPFLTVSCGGVTAFTLTGQQLATGTTLVQPQAFGPPHTQKIDADPFAAIAFFCAILGGAISLVGHRLAGAAALSGGAGALSLVIMRSRLDDQLQTQGQGLAKATYETGFTLAIISLIAGVAWNMYFSLRATTSNEIVEPVQHTERSSDHRSPLQSESPRSSSQE